VRKSCNLYHICLPALFVAAYWLVQIPKLDLPCVFRLSFTYCCYFAIIVLFITGVPHVIQKADNTALYSIAQGGIQLIRGKPLLLQQQFDSLRLRSPSESRVSEAMYLIEKYAPHRQRVALFIDPDLTTETLMLSGKTNVFPLSNPTQDFLEGNARMAIERILHFKHPLTEGDFVFIANDWGELNELQQKLLQRLGREFKPENVETTAHGIVAVRLLSAGRSDVTR